MLLYKLINNLLTLMIFNFLLQANILLCYLTRFVIFRVQLKLIQIFQLKFVPNKTIDAWNTSWLYNRLIRTFLNSRKPILNWWSTPISDCRKFLDGIIQSHQLFTNYVQRITMVSRHSLKESYIGSMEWNHRPWK